MLERRIFHVPDIPVPRPALTNRLFSEKTLDRQHEKQQRDPETFAHMTDEVTHDDLLFMITGAYGDASCLQSETKMHPVPFTITRRTVT